MKTWDIQKVLNWTTSFFKSKNILQPKLSAELLLASVLKLSRMQLYLDYNYVLNSNQLKKYKEYIKKRLENIPVQYILNEAYFRKIKLYVDSNVLIPRPETELVVEKGFECIKEILSSKKKINILEIGTGSGAIAISIASEIYNYDISGISNSSWYLIATDNNKAALEIAKKNAERNLSSDKLSNIDFIDCDIFPEESSDFLNKFEGKIDLIISNPPYISQEDYSNLPIEVKKFEPKSALVAGKTGLEVYEKIFSKVKPLASYDMCYMVFETDPRISSPLEKMAKEKLKPKQVEISKDYNLRDRIAVIRMQEKN